MVLYFFIQGSYNFPSCKGEFPLLTIAKALFTHFHRYLYFFLFGVLLNGRGLFMQPTGIIPHVVKRKLSAPYFTEDILSVPFYHPPSLSLPPYVVRKEEERGRGSTPRMLSNNKS